jgi:hypothetical protein
VTVTSITQAERKLYQRLTVWNEDFRHANYFASFLLKKGWHFDPWDKKIRWSTYMQQAAFTSALVAAYCRPFVETRNGAVLSMKLAPYNDSERELHDKLKTLRNSVYAHSDVELQNVRPISIGSRATAIVTLPVLKLTRAETQKVHSMIERTSNSIDAKLQSLISRVEQ